MGRQRTAMIEIYYDGSCPLCRREIEWYRQRGTEAEFHDISQSANLPADLDFKQAMERFHIRDEHGQLRDGADAFITVWRHTPGFRWLATLLSPRPIKWLLEQAYVGFLPMRPYLQRICR
jgi:Uncharacterized protein conserved in bacteria